MRKNGSVAIGSTEMYYVSFGDGPRKLVVLPGLSDGLATVKSRAWLLASSYKKFLHGYTVYMFSRKNEMPDGYTIRDMADDQALAMKQLGIDRAFILGVSQGGMISQYIAIDHPEMAAGLILAVTAPYANDVVTGAVSGWVELAKRGDHKGLMTDTAEKIYSEAYLRKNRRFIPLVARLTKPRTYDRFLKNAYAILGFDARDELSGIKCPTLIIAGDDDDTVGNDAPYMLNEGIAGSELYIYHGLGHGTYEEAKDFYDRVLAFCERQTTVQEGAVKMKLSKIFEERPAQWGFRGDPYFWDHLKGLAEDMDPVAPDELEEWIKKEYLSVAGKPMTDKYGDFAVVEQFAHGGMSSGGVDNLWWINKGIPLLKSRLAEL